MNREMKAIFQSSEEHPKMYKLELWTVSPNGNGLKMLSELKTNQGLLSTFNTWIYNGWLRDDDANPMIFKAVENNEELPKTTMYLYNLWRRLLPNGRKQIKRRSVLRKVYANTRRTQKPHPTTEIRKITYWCAWLAHRSKNLYKTLPAMQKERFPQLWAKTMQISTIHGDMCCLWRTIRRFVKSNYPMNNKIPIIVFDDNEPTISTKKHFEILLNAWHFSRRYDSKMPYIGEFIGEWLNRHYPMELKIIDDPRGHALYHGFIATSLYRANQNQSSIDVAIKEVKEMTKIEPSLRQYELNTSDEVKAYYANSYCIHCSGRMNPSERSDTELSCKCYELDESPYWT